MPSQFTRARAAGAHFALGVFVKGPQRPQGMFPARAGRRTGLGTIPALAGMFRAGRFLGVDAPTLAATTIQRGG